MLEHATWQKKCDTKKDVPCVFPFEYTKSSETKEYDSCTTYAEDDAKLWCGITAEVTSSTATWGLCAVCYGKLSFKNLLNQFWCIL